MNRLRLILALFFISACLASPARAESIKLALQGLTAASTMELRCTSDSRDIQLPVPERWALQRVVLNLRYMVSGTLKPDLSQLIVKVGGTSIAQTRLQSLGPDASLAIPIPLELLKPGYNTITIQVAQNSADNRCGFCTPDLWTAVSLQESNFQVDYKLKPLSLALSELSSVIFDPRLMPKGTVHIVTTDLSANAATLAGIVASGVARRFDYRKVTFSVSNEFRPGVDNILIGKREELLRAFGKYNLPFDKVEGGYLKLLHLPSGTGTADPTHALVIVTGDSDEAVRLAAVTFANITFAFPGSDEARLFEFSMPDIVQYSGREALNSGITYDLQTLNFPTQTFVGANSGGGTLSFRLPPDFSIRANQYAKLSLNFSYGAGLRPSSSFVLSVNDRKIRAIALESPAGSFIENYKVEIPTYVFKPGANRIDLVPKLHSTAKECENIQPDSMFLTLFGNSTLVFPDMPHLVDMPKIQLFMHNGFPFTRWPDGAETTVVLGAQDERLLAAGLNLIGLATQRNGFPLFGAQFSYEQPKTGDFMLVGLPGQFPEAIIKAAPLSLGSEISQIPYPVIRGWNSETTASFSKQKSSLGDGKGLLMEFQSPYETGRTALMLTAGRIEDVLAVSEALLDPGVQGKSDGDLVLIEPGEPDAKVQAMSAGPRYMTGKGGTSTVIQSFLYTQPVVYYSAIVAAILALAGAIFFAVRRYRLKHRPPEN